MIQHYYEYMVDISIIFGANITTAPLEMLDVLNFERSLANVSNFGLHIELRLVILERRFKTSSDLIR